MLIHTDAGFIADRYDLIGVMKDTSTGGFHATYWEDKPLPGNPNLGIVHPKSKMHHTTGADSFAGALEHIREMRAKIAIEDASVWVPEDKVIERRLCRLGIADVMTIPKWR